MKNLIVLTFGLLLATPVIAHPSDLRDFATDGCSLSPDSPLLSWGPGQQFLACCLKHDIAYFQGGERADRWHADWKFRQCLKGTGHKHHADIYFLAVRFGGHPLSPAEFRWGYGWSWGRGFKAVTPEERAAVKHRLDQFNCVEAVSTLLESGTDWLADYDDRIMASEEICKRAGFEIDPSLVHQYENPYE